MAAIRVKFYGSNKQLMDLPVPKACPVFLQSKNVAMLCLLRVSSEMYDSSLIGQEQKKHHCTKLSTHYRLEWKAAQPE